MVGALIVGVLYGTSGRSKKQPAVTPRTTSPFTSTVLAPTDFAACLGEPLSSPYKFEGPVKPVILGSRCVPDPTASNTQTGGWYSTLLVNHGLAPKSVSIDWVYTPLVNGTGGTATTKDQNVVLGACTNLLNSGSVQFAIWPDGSARGYSWQLFVVTGPPAVYHPLAKGTSPSLAVDGTTHYTATIKFDARTSSVTVSWPPNQTQTFSDPLIAQNWGSWEFLQLRRGKPDTDGGAAFLPQVRVGGN